MLHGPTHFPNQDHCKRLSKLVSNRFKLKTAITGYRLETYIKAMRQCHPFWNCSGQRQESKQEIRGERRNNKENLQ